MKKRILMLIAMVAAAVSLQCVTVHAQENRTEVPTENTAQAGTEAGKNAEPDNGMTAASGSAVTAASGSAVTSDASVGEDADVDTTDADVNEESADGEIVAADGAGTEEDAIDTEEDEKQEEAAAKKKTKTPAKKTAAKKTAAVKKTYTNGELKLLACLIYAEAGNQPYKGKLAVANVVLNRVKSNLFPDTIKGVIYQKTYSRSYGRNIYQFSVAAPSVGTLKKAWNVYGKRTNAAEKAQEAECIKAAKAALEGQNAFNKRYLFFSRYSNGLASRHPNGVKLSAHYFYK